MIYLKKYENWFNSPDESNRLEPQIDDYILLNMKGFGDKDFEKFFENNIGQLIGTDSHFNKKRFEIAYDYINIPWNLLVYFTNRNGIYSIQFSLSTIEYWAKDKKDVERYLEAKKYNL